MSVLREYVKLRYMGNCKCGDCQLVPTKVLFDQDAKFDALVQALQVLVDQINDYERVNNLAPNPGRTECWDSVAHAKQVLAVVSGVGESNG